MRKSIWSFFILFIFLAISISACAPIQALTQTPTVLPNVSLPTLSLGTLPDNVGQALDQAIKNEYCSPTSFTAKSIRMMSQMKGVESGYVEMESTNPLLPFSVMDGGEATLNPVSPSRLKIKGLFDGTDISILNYEEFIIEVTADTDFGSVIVSKGSSIVRENGSWVLKD